VAAHPGRTLTDDLQPTPTRGCSWSVRPVACVSGPVVAEERRRGHQRGGTGHRRRRTRRSCNMRQLCGQRATRVFVCPRPRRRARSRRRRDVLPSFGSRCEDGGGGSARHPSSCRWKKSVAATPSAWGRAAPWRAAAAAAATGCFHRLGVGARRRRCRAFGTLRRRRWIKRGPMGLY